MRILIVIPTYEPFYLHHPELEDFYTQNFDSFYHAQGDFDLNLVITDFASSKSYKAFLRNYVGNRPGCFLIDGEQEASRLVAFNIALDNFDYDYVAHGACDLRTRDGHWLEILLKEFDDPRVQIAVPTVTQDGSISCEQDQSGPIERESRSVAPEEQFNIHSPIFSHRFFQHFDNRYTDIFDWHFSENALRYQLAALGYIAKINFRVNLVHGSKDVLPLKPGNVPVGWASRNHLHEADQERYLRRAAYLLNFIPTPGGSFTEKIRLHLRWWKAQGWRYFYFHLFSRPALHDFSKLDFQAKVEVMQSLFYRPRSEYQQYSYSIYPSETDNNAAVVSSATPATMST